MISFYRFKDAKDKAHQIIQEAGDTRQEWLTSYTRDKMVVVPMEVLSILLLVAEGEVVE